MYFKLALGNVKKSIRDYGIYFLTLVFGVCVFYAFNSITQQGVVLNLNETQGGLIELLAELIGGVSIFIAVILGFLIVYASRYLIRKRKLEFGTYLLLGMAPRKVSRIIVYETLCVGLVSLIVGLAAGLLLSQVLLYVTAALFTVTMDMFVFAFSWEAFIKTGIYFGVIFCIALVFNAGAVSRYKLIDLINANKKNEGFKLRNRALSVILFIVSLMLIGAAYALLVENGLRGFDLQFLAATVLVCIGTFLFFFSLAGFLLRAVQANRGLYLRGLNMFTLRQLNAKVNTAFVSITMVCLALFLAITSTCGGFAMCTVFTQNLEATTLYDATLKVSYGSGEPDSKETDPWIKDAQADAYDMERALNRDISNWDSLVKDAAQTDLYISDISFQYMFDNSDHETSSLLYMDNPESHFLYLVSLSDFNEQRALIGLEPLSLGADEYMLWCDFDEVKEVYHSFLERKEDLVINGVPLQASEHELETTLTETSALMMNAGTIVVADDTIQTSSLPFISILNVMYNGEREAVEDSFIETLKTVYGDSSSSTWPYMHEFTAKQAYDQSISLSAVIAYLAIYIGFVLLITCAAILALQQLSEAADSTTRYSLLKKLGADEGMMNKTLFVQIGIYFVFPLVVALCHSFVALKVVVQVVSLYGHLAIAGPLLATVALFLLVYGGYFLFTYFASRTMIHTSRRSTP